MRYLQYLCSRQLVRMLKPVCSYLRLRVPVELSFGTVPWECPPPLSDGPFKLPALGPAPPSPNMPKRKAEFTHGHPHAARMAARLGRIIYSKQVHHLGSARAPGNAGYSAFQHKKDARNLAGRAQKLPPARLLPCYDRARLRSSWRIIATVSASRETDSRFLAHAAT